MMVTILNDKQPKKLGNSLAFIIGKKEFPLVITKRYKIGIAEMPVITDEDVPEVVPDVDETES